ncbi:MAG: hypothetical protein ACK2TZ_06205, partial [Anaerolineales bacterium]
MDITVETMWISATYICPVRGLAGLDPPDPVNLGRTAGIAGSLGLERLVIPILEESLLRADRHKMRFLDALIRVLDHADDVGMKIWLMAAAQRLLGVDWVAPYLVKGSLEPAAAAVFVDGAMRTLRPFMWWAEPSIIRKRLESFRELVAAISGHPALSGWIIMDRVLEWPRPAFQTADLILKSYCAEIRDRDETGEIWLSLGVSELLDPKMVQLLAGQVDGLYMRGIENGLGGFKACLDLAEEITRSAYFYSMAHWLFETQVSLELGWSRMTNPGFREEMLASVSILRRQEVPGVTWLNLIDPQNRIVSEPPWNLRPGLEKIGLLDPGGDPKEGVDTLMGAFRSSPQKNRVIDFIDIDQKEYMDDPQTHLSRLWGHFRESTA